MKSLNKDESLSKDEAWLADYLAVTSDITKIYLQINVLSANSDKTRREISNFINESYWEPVVECWKNFHFNESY